MFSISAVVFVIGLLLIFAARLLSVQSGVKLLVFIVLIGLAFLISWATFFGALRYRPSSDKVADDLVSSIIFGIFY